MQHADAVFVPIVPVDEHCRRWHFRPLGRLWGGESMIGAGVAGPRPRARWRTLSGLGRLPRSAWAGDRPTESVQHVLGSDVLVLQYVLARSIGSSSVAKLLAGSGPTFLDRNR
jgi:hypothetical protein